MAALVFSKLYTNDSYGLLDVCIGNEPDNTMSKFFIQEQRQCNDLSTVTLSDYDAVTWERSTPLITTREVTALGIKTFPQIGSVGFYKLKHEPKSLVIAPIHSKNTLYARPSISLNIYLATNTWRVLVTSPDSVAYDCFRVVVRNGVFADEYITYDGAVAINEPKAPGIYEISAFGYINEVLASEESEIIYRTVIDDSVELLADENGDVLEFGDTILIVD